MYECKTICGVFFGHFHASQYHTWQTTFENSNVFTTVIKYLFKRQIMIYTKVAKKVFDPLRVMTFFSPKSNAL